MLLRNKLRSIKFAVCVLLALAITGCAGGHHADHSEGHGHGAASDDHHETLAGKPGKLSAVSRTMQVDMNDTMRFSPASFQVKAGETIKFEVKNSGKIVHEFILGSTEDIMEHHELMKKFPSMEHDEPNSVSLEPGGMGDVVWQFTNAGTVSIACLQPGHFEAGMKGDVTVSSN